MPALLIKDFPPQLHKKLSHLAKENQRSLMRQALVILEEALTVPTKLFVPPKPFKLPVSLTKKWLDRAKVGRE